MKTKKIKKYLLFSTAAGIGVILFFFIFIGFWIGYEVISNCREARHEYSGDCVVALSSLLKDEKKDFRARNDAIWVLGQLGDSRALPVLQSFYTGKIPPREPLDKTISQYELKKAIKLTAGAPNITAFIWRGMLNI